MPLILHGAISIDGIITEFGTAARFIYRVAGKH
jgi:hypothetical protein